MMMRFDSAEILNLVIGRERAHTWKTPKHTFYKPYDELCEQRTWLHFIFGRLFVSLPEFYTTPKQYFRIIFFLLALLSAAADDEAGTQKRNSAWSSTPFYSFFQLELF
jgi:hypothetical protein